LGTYRSNQEKFLAQLWSIPVSDLCRDVDPVRCQSNRQSPRGPRGRQEVELPLDQKRWLEDDAAPRLRILRCGDQPCLKIFAMNRLSYPESSANSWPGPAAVDFSRYFTSWQIGSPGW
jgi:hypothetical protein